MVTENEQWPSLPYEEWKDTYATLHMWTQIVGKIALAQAPPLNHSWAWRCMVTPRGLVDADAAARRAHVHDGVRLHRSSARDPDVRRRRAARCRCAPRSVADFYADVMATLDGMALPVKIWPMAVEIPVADPARHGRGASLLRSGATRIAAGRILSQVARVFEGSRCDFVGKCSPVHFFWGAFDLAVTRFSGRPAPPREGPAFMREAYSHEVISHGFWPGSGPVLEPAFYAYAVPEPPGLKAARVQPRGAFYHGELGEFILPYETVRKARLAGARDPRVRRQHLRTGGDARAVEPCRARAGGALKCCAHLSDQRAAETQRHAS